jgi:hypothetical protein
MKFSGMSGLVASTTIGGAIGFWASLEMASFKWKIGYTAIGLILGFVAGLVMTAVDRRRNANSKSGNQK